MWWQCDELELGSDGLAMSRSSDDGLVISQSWLVTVSA